MIFLFFFFVFLFFCLFFFLKKITILLISFFNKKYIDMLKIAKISLQLLKIIVIIGKMDFFVQDMNRHGIVQIQLKHTMYLGEKLKLNFVFVFKIKRIVRSLISIFIFCEKQKTVLNMLKTMLKFILIMFIMTFLA